MSFYIYLYFCRQKLIIKDKYNENKKTLDNIYCGNGSVF